MKNVWILAQTEGDEPISTVPAEPVTEEGQTIQKTPADSNELVTRQRKPFGGTELIFIALMFVVMYLLLFRGPRKKQQEHKRMVQSLQKNDRVRTIGGIIGTVMDIKDDEIILKVDESNNTKIKVAPSAIGRNLSKDKS